MSKNQSKTRVVRVLISVLVLGGIGIAGQPVFNRQTIDSKNQHQRSQQANQMIDASDTANIFSYSYPSKWSLQKYTWSDCCEGPPHVEPDWTKQTQPITLIVKTSPIKAAIHIADSNSNAVETAYGSRIVDKFNTYTKLKLNGYDALHHVTDFVGPSEAEKYKDDEYIISTGSKSVRLQFRERYSNSTINHINDFNATGLVPEFDKIAKSIKFFE